LVPEENTMRILIAGNWKMNTSLSEAVNLVKEMLSGLDEVTGVDKVICPPFISLAAIKEIIRGSSVKLGAQNVYFEEKGAYTGEISPLMLSGLCEFVIVGHSERRQYFKENGELVNKKIRAALKAGLKPILCVGEQLAENEAGQTEAVITRQLKSALENIAYNSELVIAYEPVWAIGTGRAATSEQANNIIGLIRNNMAKLYNKESAEQVRILYGGSVTAANATELIQKPEIDGALVGGASLKANDFISIVKQASAITQT